MTVQLADEVRLQTHRSAHCAKEIQELLGNTVTVVDDDAKMSRHFQS